jgi:hypothetical protein
MLSADHRARLRRSLDTFLEENAPSAADLCHAAKALGVIPITDDRQRDFGIRLSDGKIVSFNRHEPFDLHIVAVPNAELAVLGHAWTKFPELVAFVPTRPADATDCPACSGSGVSKHEELSSGLSCYCGGLGWVFRDGWSTKG